MEFRCFQWVFRLNYKVQLEFKMMVTMSSAKGLFITLEGGEGSGKSTLINQLAASLKSQGRQVVVTREPGGSTLGNTIRQWLLNDDATVKVGAQAELLLFLAARAQHIEELIRPSLEAGAIVLCDRFNDSTIAYQGAARELDPTIVKQLCRMICKDIQPQLTLLLDLSPEVGLQRTKKLTKENASSGQLDRIEAETHGFHERVRAGFLSLAKEEPTRIRCLDATKPQQHVYEEAWKIIEKLIK